MSAGMGAALADVMLYALAAVGLLTVACIAWGVVGAMADARRDRLYARRAGAGPRARG
jgi:hypothetical protein